LYNKIVDILQKFDSNIYQQDSIKCGEMFERYSVEAWRNNVETLLDSFLCHDQGDQKRKDIYKRSFDKLRITSILLVSDYLHRFGGIEAFFYESKVQLESLVSGVDIYGSQITTCRGRKI
jgi:hypothetical protein